MQQRKPNKNKQAKKAEHNRDQPTITFPTNPRGEEDLTSLVIKVTALYESTGCFTQKH